MTKIIVEKLNMSEGDLDIGLNDDIRDHAITSKETLINLGEVGFIESISIKDKDELDICFKDAVVRIKIRE